VNDAGTGEVTEAQVTQVEHAEHVSTAPGPRAFQRVDEAGHEHGEDQERPQLHTLGNRTRHDGHGGSDEDHLEEEVGSGRVDRATLEATVTGGEIAQDAFDIDAGDAGEEVAAAVHDGVTAHQVHDAGNGEQGHVLGQDFSGVLGAHQTGFQHGKACCHPHNQCTAHQKIKGIYSVLQVKKIAFHGKPSAQGLSNQKFLRWLRIIMSVIRLLLRRSRQSGSGWPEPARSRKSCRHRSCRCWLLW